VKVIGVISPFHKQCRSTAMNCDVSSRGGSPHGKPSTM
jgi:hypothetical protein